MSRVLFLGAGACVDADYPLTTKLLEEMENRFHESRMFNDKRDWDVFESFRQNATGVLATILRSPNPELILTIPDLLEAALNEGDQNNWRQLKDAANRGDEDAVATVNAWWNLPDREALYQGRLAKRAFQRVADRFFSHNHARDSQPEQRGKREYLHTAFCSLEAGDTVVTTNWDTLAERTLMEAGRWLPTDGYGFNVTIESRGSARLRNARTPLAGNSEIRVLKLHGSVGWFRRSEGGTTGDHYLRGPNFLQYLTPPDDQGPIQDRTAPPSGSGPDENPIIIVPSYLKQLEDPVLQSIWDQAATALTNADEVTFVGYSLPSADVAVRVLLNSLRQRLLNDDFAVTVVNPDKAVLDRWRTFLGDRINAAPKTAQMFYGGDSKPLGLR